MCCSIRNSSLKFCHTGPSSHWQVRDANLISRDDLEGVFNVLRVLPVDDVDPADQMLGAELEVTAAAAADECAAGFPVVNVTNRVIHSVFRQLHH